MSNKVKYNLKNVHAAKLTETVTEGLTSYSYATPQAIPGAVSITLDAEGDSSPFYADGIVYFRSYANNGYSGDLEIALIPEWFRTEITGSISITDTRRTRCLISVSPTSSRRRSSLYRSSGRSVCLLRSTDGYR